MNARAHEIIGNGDKTIVFVHYFGGDAGSWQWSAKRLKKNHRCILLNLPGFGGTPALENPSIYGFATYIIDQIESLQLTDYTLCGHSMGAKLVLYAVKLMKNNLPNSIILVAPSPPTVEDMPKKEKDRMLNHPNATEALHTVSGAVVRKLGKKKKTYAVQSQLRIDKNTWRWWLQEGMENNIAERIQGIDVPIHVIFSNDDPVIASQAIYDEVLPQLERPSVVALAKVGHLIPMETPRKLARQIKRITARSVPVAEVNVA